jgi:hypothetical protein
MQRRCDVRLTLNSVAINGRKTYEMNWFIAN